MVLFSFLFFVEFLNNGFIILPYFIALFAIVAVSVVSRTTSIDRTVIMGLFCVLIHFFNTSSLGLGIIIFEYNAKPADNRITQIKSVVRLSISTIQLHLSNPPFKLFNFCFVENCIFHQFLSYEP